MSDSLPDLIYYSAKDLMKNPGRALHRWGKTGTEVVMMINLPSICNSA